MQALENTSRIVADDLRKAERSINLAARDTTQLLLTMLDATETHQISPAFAQRSVKATVAALSALVEGQDQMAMRAHPLAVKVGRQLGLTETSWGENVPKPPMASIDERAPEPVIR
ncbi:hypothetical protein [Sphingomonas carotinifaciens]|uniref:Uncharacterized protein n=1 Tax=Sphingomonas carotinifaciens TaxID=1166323 RepID=A0A1G7PYV0_9SPHN|nr:hypothetical protein [Sphingomonas carotinifaciens]MBB4087564.1 hypothetical protein [Sphingomonas carotinifaciens]MWC45647.1 hypothetical protein [Sphingomonas carotinifaciens]SDF91388.1 hypothetical protein SAMN05216557_107138 [Sphingomonas carotinifaciens]